MTREEYSRDVLANLQGLDGYDSGMDPDSFGADDPVKRAGLSTIRAGLSQANNTALAVNLFAESDLDSTTLPTGLASINGTATAGAYHRVIRYLLANPSKLQSMLINSSEAAPAAILGSMTLTPSRTTPFALSTTNQVPIQSYQTTQDFQANRVTVPIVLTLDALSFVAIATDNQTTASTITFTVTCFFGQRREIRAGLRPASGVAMRPGGRGVVKAR